jgi:dipeptidyl aminopeptidase/acylaminoacyl peptidase
MRSYAWSADSKRIYILSNLRGFSSLWKVDLRSGKSTRILIDPVVGAAQIDGAGDELVILGSGVKDPKQIWQINGETLSLAVENPLPEIVQAAATQPEEITFLSGDHQEVYGYYYPPAGNHAARGAPPLILDIHGGPTGQDLPCFSGDAAFFNSRDYAYALLNYRGSSGYGYDYQDALRHNWGVVDVEDTFNFTQELIRRGLANSEKLVLFGSSAGGFTALNVLIRYPGLFKAAICSYPVSDLVDDARHTHKFERYYHRFLTGNLEKDYQRFVERSPIFPSTASRTRLRFSTATATRCCACAIDRNI